MVTTLATNGEGYELIEDGGYIILHTPRAQEGYRYPDPLIEWAEAEAASGDRTAWDIMQAALRGEMPERMAELLDWCIDNLTPSREITLYETDSGGLLLYVTERGEVIYAHDYTGREDDCARDIAVLREDRVDAPYTWDGHDRQLADDWEVETSNSALIYRHVPAGEEERCGEYTDRWTVRPDLAGRLVLAAMGLDKTEDE